MRSTGKRGSSPLWNVAETVRLHCRISFGTLLKIRRAFEKSAAMQLEKNGGARLLSAKSISRMATNTTQGLLFQDNNAPFPNLPGLLDDNTVAKVKELGSDRHHRTDKCCTRRYSCWLLYIRHDIG